MAITFPFKVLFLESRNLLPALLPLPEAILELSSWSIQRVASFSILFGIIIESLLLISTRDLIHEGVSGLHGGM